MWLLYFFFTFFLGWTLIKYSIKPNIREKSVFPVRASSFTFWNIALGCIIVSSLRFPKIGTDTFVYKSIFEIIGKSDNIFGFAYEYGFVFFTKLVSSISSDFYAYLFVINIVIWLCLFLFLKRNSENFSLSLWLFLLLGFLDSSMCLIRQFMALSILLMSYKYLVARRLLIFILFVCLASSFHITSFVFIISYFMWNIKVGGKKALLCYIALCIGTYLLSNQFFVLLESLGIYSEYLLNSNYGLQENSKLAPILNFFQLFLLVVFCMQCNRRCDEPIINNMIALVAIASFFTILSFRFTQIGRVASYFSIFIIVLLPNTLRKLPVYERNAWTLFFLAVFIMRYVVIAYFRPEWSGVYPYKFFFQ